jgi:ATP-binding cassette subfamily C protein
VSAPCTLVDLLLGLLVPTAGAVRLDAAPLAELDVAAWQRRVGYVPQTPYFTDDTLCANVAFGVPRGAVDEPRVTECLARASLADLVASLPQGLDTSLGDRALKISGGERQRIAIARALYREPDVLVLDEATSALDPVSQSAVARALESLRGRVTTIIISHQANAIAACDRVFVLNGGRLVAEGSFEDVVLGSSLRETVSHGSST